jgi:chromosome segregation ATPase
MTSPADTIREALTILYDHGHHDNGPALAALTELEQQLAAKTEEANHWRMDYNAEAAIATKHLDRAEAAEAACEKAIRERRSLEIKEDDWHRAYEAAEAEVKRLQKIERNNSVLFDKMKAAEADRDRLREALEWMANYNLTGTERTLHIDFQGKARQLLDALDARADWWDHAELDRMRDRAVAAEADRDRLQAEVDRLDRMTAEMSTLLRDTGDEAQTLRDALEQAVRTIDRWDATIGQPPDPPSAEEVLFGVRDIARAALDRHTNHTQEAKP